MALLAQLSKISVSSATLRCFNPAHHDKREMHHKLATPSKSVDFHQRSLRVFYRNQKTEHDEEHEGGDVVTFGEAVVLFNKGEFYKCHDLLEALWMEAEDPTRTLLHGVLQCAVGFHHLFSQNHKGAMMELGEGLCKLRKLGIPSGPFHQFEQEIAEVLEFVYQTQIEFAACRGDSCETMDQPERAYQLLGGYAAGEQLYSQKKDGGGISHIVFCPQSSSSTSTALAKVKLPFLSATDEHLLYI